MKTKIFFILALSILALTSCNSFTRKCGGTSYVHVQKGYKVVEATWKGSSLWYLTEPMDSTYTPKTKIFVESSNLGMVEGKVLFVESR